MEYQRENAFGLLSENSYLDDILKTATSSLQLDKDNENSLLFQNEGNNYNYNVNYKEIKNPSILFSIAKISSNHLCKFLSCSSKEGWGPFSSKHGDLTPCFTESIGILLALFIVITGSIQLLLFLRRPKVVPAFTHSLYLRLALVLSAFIIQILNTFTITISWDVSFLVPFSLLLLNTLFILPTHFLELYYQPLVQSGFLLFFWFFNSSFAFLKLINLALRLHSTSTFSKFHFATQVLYLSSSISVLLAESLIENPRALYIALSSSTDNHYGITATSGKSSLPPYEVANIFSRLSFSWITPLMKLGYKHYLTADDLPELPHENTADITYNAFERNWKHQVTHKNKPSLFLALTYSFGWEFFIGGIFKSFQDVLNFVQPYLLRLLIIFVTSYQYPPSDDKKPPIAEGVVIALSMLVVAIAQTSFLHQYFHRVFRTGMNIKSSLTAAVYRKALGLSNEARVLQTTGDIVNLMSVDVQRLQDLTTYGQSIWSGPFQIILCLVSLYKLLGNSMWAGFIILIIMIPCNALIARRQKSLQKVQMRNKDERTRLTNELLTNIKSVKLYSWETPFLDKLAYVRNKLELVTLKKMGLWQALTNFLWNCTPFFVSCITFAIFVYTNEKPLTTDIVFPALALFNLLSFPLAIIPMVVTSAIEASVAISRLTKFLTAEELQKDAVTRIPLSSAQPSANSSDSRPIVASMKHGSFLWERHPSYKVILSDISIDVKAGELCCIVGRVGSGKSSLCQAFLGMLYKSSGQVTVAGSIAYASQTPYIMNATVRDNILFGLPLNQAFYEQTIKACCLGEDLSILPDGDQTEVGEKGISLSGGQKARVALARAVYSRADLYILDDVLSAVDQHVGRALLDNVLGPSGMLGSKTVLLATNNINVLSIASSIVMLEGGRTSELGTYDELVSKKGKVYALLKEFGGIRKSAPPSTAASSINLSSKNSTSVASSIQNLKNSKVKSTNTSISNESTSKKAKNLNGSVNSPPTLKNLENNGITEVQKFGQNKEVSEQGKVKWSVYKEYAKASNIYGVVAFLLFLVCSMAISVGGNVWLKHWAEVNTKLGFNAHASKYLGIYFAFGITSAFCTVIQTVILWIFCNIQSATVLHNNLAHSVVRAPMSFFETTPVGRILNRFSSDIYKVDEILSRVFSMFFANSVKVLFTLIVISYSTPGFLLFIFPLSFLYIYYQRFYLRTSRELKRLDSVTKSPIYAHFQESLGGITTIRAYDQINRFNKSNERAVDLNMSAYFPSVSANRWLAVRLEFLGSVIIFLAAILTIIAVTYSSISPGIVGLSMSYALQITQSLNWIVRMTVDVETNIVSVERILEYTNLKPEAPEVIPNNRPPTDWPSKGHVSFEKYSARYREGLNLVLKDISLNVKPKEKIGIVGRTGAGKSSLTLALFRIIEAASGHIEIDGLNTSTIGLKDLRSRLAIIPQDSQAFEGTVRDNLDPEHVHSDETLWHVLKLSHLVSHISAMEGGLDAAVSEYGSNFSTGQRQLLSLARALLTPSTILVLDEATAAVDVQTDQVLQQTIRSEFKDRTILTIAHRLNTIMDSDRIVVLSKGEVVEFDTPQNLLADKNSEFYSLSQEGESALA